MKRSLPLPLSALAVGLLLAAPSATQSSEPLNQGPDLVGELQRWKLDRGDEWHSRASRGTGYARFLYGGKAAASRLARSDADYLQVTREFVQEAKPLLGIEESTLVDDRVKFLPLALSGTTDKISVQMRQVVHGVPVVDGWVNAIYHEGGELLSIDSKAQPNLLDFDTIPSLSAEGALRFATSTFRATVGMRPTEVGAPRLVIFREELEKGSTAPRLAWEIELMFRGVGGDLEGYRYYVAADGQARVIERQNLVHEFDVGGQVFSFATPGTLPDITSNPPASFPMAYATVTSSAGTTTTDANGFFNYPGVSGPLSVTFSYNGLYNEVLHDTDAEYSLTQSLSGTGNTVTMNPAPTEEITAQANAFRQINLMRDWTRTIDPSDGMMDNVNRAVVNVEFRNFGFIITNCNAVYVGTETNYWWEDGGCANTAFSSVVHHEQGHWQNDRYGSGNGSDGFGEGNADNFATFVNDDPILGDTFFLSGGFVRTALNTRQYCGDGNGGCYGSVHADGEVLMGAMWKMRDALNNTYGNTQGDLIADTLFLGWMNGYNQSTIDSIIITQLMTLDDDDGNINNGTPNSADINDGFAQQGFPTFQPAFIGFSNQIDPPDTLDEAGPYGIAADLTANINSSIVSASVFYSVNGGSYLEAPMTLASGTQWTALIPGIASPARVDYYVEATDDQGQTESFPDNAPSGGTTGFKIGELELFFEDDFETSGDNGWTHFQIATQDDWQHDVPNGASGSDSGVSWSDPASAFSGSQIWGNDLAPSGFNGAYQPDVINQLLSPVLDLSGASGTTLSYQRWLTVEEGIFDQAEIRVNGNQVWANPLNGNLLDTAWTREEVDISAFADGNSSVQLEWRLTTDGGLNLGGWNIDDVCVSTLDASPVVGLPTTYGAGLAGTNGVPVIDSKGQPTNIGNLDHVVAIKNGVPGATTYVLLGSLPLDFFVPVLKSNLLVTPEVGFTVNLDVFGQAEVAQPVPNSPSAVGLSFYYQGFVTDSGSIGPFSITEGLQVTLAP